MIVFRKRLIYWLVKEYIRKWGKAIALSFIVGLLVFFAILTMLRYFAPKIPIGKNETIGIVGAYHLDSLPDYITKDMSMGLTQLLENGTPKPALATHWRIEDDGKRYTFYIRHDGMFSDGSSVTSGDIQYNFSDVSVKRPDAYTIVFALKDSYSPFLTTATRPVFKKSLVGTGDYKLKNVVLNGNFVQSLTLALVKNIYQIKTYQFYPSTQAVKTAYALGEVSKAIGLYDTAYNNTAFEHFANTKVEKKINEKQLVTLFYNTQDTTLSDKRLRSALSYAIPDTFDEGKRAYMPYPQALWAYDGTYNFSQDIDRAKILLSSTDVGTKSATLKLEIKTFAHYKKTAAEIAKSWEKLGVKTKITVVDGTPENFQTFLGDFFVPKDPDQYTLWHAAQRNNIARYENKRIDKLLEDGRKIVDVEERKKIYSDFQKYLTSDSPASFLYFPYEYEITRK